MLHKLSALLSVSALYFRVHPQTRVLSFELTHGRFHKFAQFVFRFLNHMDDRFVVKVVHTADSGPLKEEETVLIPCDTAQAAEALADKLRLWQKDGQGLLVVKGTEVPPQDLVHVMEEFHDCLFVENYLDLPDGDTSVGDSLVEDAGTSSESFNGGQN